jgi:hypothetical protein
MIKEYKDNQEFFTDVHALQKELENNGEFEAAKEIKEGIGLINGLTDGWAMFLESLNKVNLEYSSSFSTEQKEKLSYYIKLTHKVVHRE